MFRKVGQDSNRILAAARAGGAALLLAAAGCGALPPPAAVSTPYGEVRAERPEAAQELAESLLRLRPLVLALLPDSVERPTEVWLDPELHEGKDGSPGVAAITSLSQGRIRIGAGAAGIGRDFLLAHELVHAYMGPSWAPLPAIMKEGLCDALACRLVPQDAARARALRLFAARFAFGPQELLLSCSQPAFGGRSGARLAISSPGGERRGPFEALELSGRGVRLHDEPADEDVLYGYGLLLVERAIERIGLAGLHALCERAAETGHELLPLEWVLWAAELDHEPATWQRALAEGLGAPELEALTAHIATGLAEGVVSSTRWRFPDLSGERFLEEATPTLGLRGGDLQLALSDLPGLRDAVLAAWARQTPTPLRPGENTVYVDAGGLHLGLVLDWRPETPDMVLQWMRVPAPLVPDEAQPPAPAVLETLVRLGAGADGPFLSSTLPEGFDEFRVSVLGVTIADLRFALNTRVSHDESGATTVTCRLDPALVLHAALFYPEHPNVLVVQRAAGGADEQRVPIDIPLER